MFELEYPALEDWEFDAEKTDAFSRPVLYLRGSGRDAEDSEIVQSWFPQTEEYVVEGADHTFTPYDALHLAASVGDIFVASDETDEGFAPGLDLRAVAVE